MRQELLDRIPVCKHGTKENIKEDLLLALNRLEQTLGYPLDYSSGYRCPECNLKAQGVPHSAHIQGEAVDTRAHQSSIRFHIISEAIKQGFTRIGIGKNFIHLDISTTLPQQVAWLY